MKIHYNKTTIKRVFSLLLICILMLYPAMEHVCAASVVKKTYVVGVGCTVKKSVTGTIKSVISKNSKIVTVKKKGKKAFTLTGKKPGTTTVIVSYGSKKLRATVKVGATGIAGYDATKQNITMDQAAYQEISVRVKNGKNDKIKWTSSNKNVVEPASATVSVGGSGNTLVKNTLLAKGKGTVAITAASATTGKKYSFTVSVQEKKIIFTPYPYHTMQVMVSPSVSIVPSPTAHVPQVTTAPSISAEPTVFLTESPVTAVPTVSAKPTGTPIVTITPSAIVPTMEATPSLSVTDTPQPTTQVFEDTETAKVKDAFICAENKIQIDFTERLYAVDTSNIYINGVTVLDASLSPDKRSILVKTSALSTYENYTLAVANILSSNGKRIHTENRTMTYRELRYSLKLEAEEDCSVIKASTGSSIHLTATLYNEQGKLVKDKAKIYFSTTKGVISDRLIPLENGQAQATLQASNYEERQTALVKAFVYTSENEKLINQAATTEIVMDPQAGSMEEVISPAFVTKVKVDSCSRVLLYFNKDIVVSDYTLNTEDNRFAYDPSKLKIRIATTDKENKTSINESDVYQTPVALLPVKGNAKAMYAILDTTQDDYLADNCYAIVEVTDKLCTPAQTTNHITSVTDNEVSYVTSVYNDGMCDLKVIFSEPVQDGSGGNSAELLDNWTLDGKELDDDAFGIRGYRTVINVGDVNLKTGEDLRNVVTIHLGKNHSLEQQFFVAGTHILGIKNVGDWANRTDMNYNHIVGTSLDIKIVHDETHPDFTAKVESPEQYCLTFSCPVAAADLEQSLKIQYKIDGYWQTIQNAQFHIEELDEAGTSYIAELKKDWTRILDTQDTGRNYYSYDLRLYVAPNSLTNPKNGCQNEECKVALDSEIMKHPDTESPLIVAVRQKGTACIVEMNKPVQISIGNETVTLSQTQQDSISTTSVNFISEDKTKTICSVIYAMEDGHDTAFKVRPNEALTPGVWQVVVRGVSDDVGNTSETSCFTEFTVTGDGISSDPQFAMVWAVGVPVGATNPITGRVESDTDDILYIKYNGNYKCYNGAANACYPLNYVVASATLSRNTQIDSSLENYNSDANMKNDHTDLVAIHLQAGTLNGETVGIQVSDRIQSVQGENLSNAGAKILSLDDGKTYYTWRYKTYNGTTSTITNTSELQAVLDDPDYVAYNLPNFTSYNMADLQHVTISHPGIYNFSANRFTNLDIRTKESGRIEISGGTFDNILIYAPNAEVYMNGTLVTTGSSPSSGKITVQEALEDHFILNNVNAKELILNDGTGGSSVRTTGNTKIGTITVNTGVNLDLQLESTYRLYILLTQRATVTYKASMEHDVYVEETAPRLHFTNQAGSVAPKLYLDEMLCSLDIVSNVTPISKQAI